MLESSNRQIGCGVYKRGMYRLVDKWLKEAKTKTLVVTFAGCLILVPSLAVWLCSRKSGASVGSLVSGLLT